MTATTAPDRNPDVLVIGAGAIGLASAWRLAQQGLSVEVVDPDPGSGASGVAAGMLAPVTEARLGEEALLELSLASWARWPDFAVEIEKSTGRDIGYRADGTVVVAADADDRALLADVADRQRAMGLDVDDLAASELRDLEPALAPAVRRGVRAVGEGSVNPAALVDALLVAADDAGVRIRRERVTALTLGGRADAKPWPERSGAGGAKSGKHAEGEAVTGVELDRGDRLAADKVVLAAGTWSGTIDGGLPPGVRPPVRPVKGQVVTLRQPPGDTVVHHTVRGYVGGSVVYLVPRDDGRLVCGATVEERGWDARPTAGGTYELLRDVLSLFPGLDEAELVGVRAGFRPGTPDDLPLIGHAALDGLIMATGHYRNGILLTPITAEAVVGLVTGSALPDEVGVCDPNRFAGTPARPGSRRRFPAGAGPVGETQSPTAASADAPAADFGPAATHTRLSNRRHPGLANPLDRPSHPAGPASSKITVVVNGEARMVDAGVSLDELVTVLELDRQGLAIAVDDEVIPRSAWGARRLGDSSRVEILTVAQGG